MTLAQLQEYIQRKSTREGRCLIWQGATDKDGVPRMREPQSGKTRGVRRMLLEAQGMDLEGKIATTSCGKLLCVCERHAVAWTRKKLMQRSAKKQTGNVALSMKRAINGRRTGKLSMEKVREMRASGLTYRKAAVVYGVTLRTIQKIMRGESWREYGSPFAAF